MITITGSEQPLHDTGKHILQPRHCFTHVTSNLKKSSEDLLQSLNEIDDQLILNFLVATELCSCSSTC
jgi:hypothetical protein